MIENFVKQVVNEGGTLNPLLIPADMVDGEGLTNPSIFTKDGKILLNLRHVKYILYHAENNQKFQNIWGGPLAYLNPENDLTLTTINYLCTVNPKTLKIQQINKVDTSKLDVKPLWEFVGLEDARIVEWDKKLYLTGVRRDTTTDGEGRMELSEIVNNKEVSRKRIEPPTFSYCEKNWMPILDMPYHYVKWTNPTEVVKVDPKTGKAKTIFLGKQTHKLDRDLRGGSQVIPYKDYRIALTHEVNLFNTEKGSKDAQYYHRFVIWDKYWNIVGMSPDFKFMTANIEFSCGMAVHDGNILIPFGFQDNTSYLLKIPQDFFEKFLNLN